MVGLGCVCMFWMYCISIVCIVGPTESIRGCVRSTAYAYVYGCMENGGRMAFAFDILAIYLSSLKEF